MSPKIVLIAFAAAIAVVAALVVVRGSRPNPPPSIASEAPATNAAVEVAPIDLAPAVVVTNVVATTPDQDKAMEQDRALEDMKDALLEGSSNPAKVESVRLYLQSADPELRKTAVETMMHLSDRAGIPALKEALAKVEDPREKVAIMDAIDYLETPEDPLAKSLDEPVTNTISTGAAK